MSDLAIIRCHVEERKVQYRAATDGLRVAEIAKGAADKQHEAAVQAQAIGQTIATGIQQQAHERIAAVVTGCLAAVLDDPYIFRVDFTNQRGTTQADRYFERRGVQIDPMECGGVTDVAAFALRVAFLMLSLPPGRRLLVLDEPSPPSVRDTATSCGKCSWA